MSHELRTPLNSLLILSDQLYKNNEGNLTGRQVEFAKTIHLSGNDLLMLINDILDLSKIESGTVAVDVSELRLDDLQRAVERSFRHVAEAKHVEFLIEAPQPLPKIIVTDVKRLQQIIKNLLSNAFKFTHQGHVSLSIEVAAGGWARDNEDLNRASQVIAFSVSDTGIGISPDKQQIDLRGVPAGRRVDLAQVRRHRPRAGDQPRAVATARRRDPARQRCRARAAPSRCTCRKATTRRARAATADGRCRTTTSRSATYRWLSTPRRCRSTDCAPPARMSLPVPAPIEVAEAVFVNVAGDDRNDVAPGDRLVLIVENDIALREGAARRRTPGRLQGARQPPAAPARSR